MVLLTIGADAFDDGRFRLDLDIALRAVPIARSGGAQILGQALFYAAISGAIVTLAGEAAQFIEWTQARPLDVQKSVTDEHVQKSDVEVLLRNGLPQLVARPDRVHLARSAKHIRKSTFNVQEYALQVVASPGNLRWDFLTPRGANVVQDFVQCPQGCYRDIQGPANPHGLDVSCCLVQF